MSPPSASPPPPAPSHSAASSCIEDAAAAMTVVHSVAAPAPAVRAQSQRPTHRVTTGWVDKAWIEGLGVGREGGEIKGHALEEGMGAAEAGGMAGFGEAKHIPFTSIIPILRALHIIRAPVSFAGELRLSPPAERPPPRDPAHPRPYPRGLAKLSTPSLLSIASPRRSTLQLAYPAPAPATEPMSRADAPQPLADSCARISVHRMGIWSQGSRADAPHPPGQHARGGCGRPGRRAAKAVKKCPLRAVCLGDAAESRGFLRPGGGGTRRRRNLAVKRRS